MVRARALLQNLPRQCCSPPCRRGYSPAPENLPPVASTSAQPFIRPDGQPREVEKDEKSASRRSKGKERAPEGAQSDIRAAASPSASIPAPLASQTGSGGAGPSSGTPATPPARSATPASSATPEEEVFSASRHSRPELLTTERDTPTPLNVLKHPFNTHVFVENLVTAGVPRARAEVLMEASRILALREVSKAESVLASKVAAENDAYLYSAALSELRTEVQVDVREEVLAQRSANARIHRRIESLSQTTNEQVDSLKSEIKYEFQHSHDETNADFKNLELRLSDVNNRISLMFGREKAEVESLRWILLRNIFLSVAGFALFSVVLNEIMRERPALPTVEQFGVHPLPDQPSEIVDPVPVRRVGEDEEEVSY